MHEQQNRSWSQCPYCLRYSRFKIGYLTVSLFKNTVYYFKTGGYWRKLIQNYLFTTAFYNNFDKATTTSVVSLFRDK